MVTAPHGPPRARQPPGALHWGRAVATRLLCCGLFPGLTAPQMPLGWCRQPHAACEELQCKRRRGWLESRGRRWGSWGSNRPAAPRGPTRWKFASAFCAEKEAEAQGQQLAGASQRLAGRWPLGDPLAGSNHGGQKNAGAGGLPGAVRAPRPLPARSQPCPRPHSCPFSVPPGTLALGQFPARPPPSGPCSFSQGGYGQREPGGGSAGYKVHAGSGPVGLGLSFPMPKRVGAEGLSCGTVGRALRSAPRVLSLSP